MKAKAFGKGVPNAKRKQWREWYGYPKRVKDEGNYKIQVPLK